MLMTYTERAAIFQMLNRCLVFETSSLDYAIRIPTLRGTSNKTLIPATRRVLEFGGGG